MKKTIICLFTILTISISGVAQSGTINFYNGNSVRFDHLQSISLVQKNTDGRVSTKDIEIMYKNARHVIPCSKVEYIEVISVESISSSLAYNPCKMLIKTKTGIEVENSNIYFKLICVNMFDELTGENKTQCYNASLSKTQANIKSIIFD